MEERAMGKKAKKSSDSENSDDDTRIPASWRLPFIREAFSDLIRKEKKSNTKKRYFSEVNQEKHIMEDDGAGFRKRAKFTLQLVENEDSSDLNTDLEDDAVSVIKNVTYSSERNVEPAPPQGEEPGEQINVIEDASEPRSNGGINDGAPAENFTDGAGILEEEEEEEEVAEGAGSGTRGRKLRFCFFIRLRSQEAEPNQPPQGP